MGIVIIACALGALVLSFISCAIWAHLRCVWWLRALLASAIALAPAAVLFFIGEGGFAIAAAAVMLGICALSLGFYYAICPGAPRWRLLAVGCALALPAAAMRLAPSLLLALLLGSLAISAFIALSLRFWLVAVLVIFAALAAAKWFF